VALLISEVLICHARAGLHFPRAVRLLGNGDARRSQNAEISTKWPDLT
jgi:hypothetical protein